MVSFLLERLSSSRRLFLTTTTGCTLAFQAKAQNGQVICSMSRQTIKKEDGRAFDPFLCPTIRCATTSSRCSSHACSDAGTAISLSTSPSRRLWEINASIEKSAFALPTSIAVKYKAIPSLMTKGATVVLRGTSPSAIGKRMRAFASAYHQTRTRSTESRIAGLLPTDRSTNKDVKARPTQSPENATRNPLNFHGHCPGSLC